MALRPPHAKEGMKTTLLNMRISVEQKRFWENMMERLDVGFNDTRGYLSDYIRNSVERCILMDYQGSQKGHDWQLYKEQVRRTAVKLLGHVPPDLSDKVNKLYKK